MSTPKRQDCADACPVHEAARDIIGRERDG